MKRLLKRRGRSICSLLAVFLMVFSLMPAQAVSAEIIDTVFSITGTFRGSEGEFKGTVTVGETCPLCRSGILEAYWSEDGTQHHSIRCDNIDCKGYIKEDCTSNATCTKEGTCTVCRTTYKADHDYEWVNPQAATCTSIGYTQRCWHCRTCGGYFDSDDLSQLNKEDVEIPITHKWAAEWSADDENHWHECTLCHATKDEAVHSGGTATFTNGPVCEVCEWEYDKPLNRDSDWEYNELLGVWFRYVYKDGDIVGIDIHNHEDHVGGTATCTAKAKCSICGEEYGDYAHIEIIDPAVPATCTTPGKTEGKHCSACSTVLVEQTEVPALTHDWGDWETITKPEIGKAGKQQRTCKREGCEETETQDIPALIGYTASISGDGNWTKGSTDSLILTVNRSEDDENCSSHYVETLIDGEAAAVTAEAGSTVVTVSPEILEKLGVGTHTVTVNFDDGNVEANLTVNEAEQKKDEPAAPPATPDTGDENSLQPWNILLAGSAACLVSVILSSKRSRVRKH